MRNFIARVVMFSLVLIFVRGHVLANEVSIESLLPQKLLGGWTQMGSPQFYNSKNLFNRVDGQAELFFKYGFQRSVAALYQNQNNPKDQVEVDLYDMGTVLQAFGIFSRFRSEDRPAGVGLDSYFEDTSLLFYQGRYFFMLYATEADPSLLRRMAITISSGIADSSRPPEEISYFPRNGLKQGSIEYYSEGLLGYQFLKRGFLGAYREVSEAKDKLRTEDQEFRLFLAVFNSSQEAQNALRTYRQAISKAGNVDSTAPARFRTGSLIGEDPNRGKVIVVAKGFYLVGALGFEKTAHAWALLEEFLKKIR